MIGQTVSHYRIVEELGGGGMGVVYKALDTRLNRFVALKFLSPNLTKDAEANERFIQEAQAASALDHPNICTIHEIDETPTRELFLTMAYYDGETLKRRLERGALPVGDAIDIALQVAQALARAHESGIIHRDIKPANLIIGKDGLVKILDFGLAKLAGHTDLTRTGTTLGTIAYMSPEQIRGIDIDTRADVWALGVVLYEMLAGRRPFDGKDDLAVISSIANDTPKPIAAIRPDVPSGLPHILSRALDRNLASRYASATELLKDLAACRAAMSGTVLTSVNLLRALRRPVVAIPAVAVLIAAGVPATMAYRRAGRARWAQNEAITQIMQLVAKDDYASAFAVAKEAERYAPANSVLANLWPQFSTEASLTSSPDGADVFVQPYAAGPNDPWESLGRTPIKRVKLPRGVFRFRMEKDAYEPRLLASNNPGALLHNLVGPRSVAGLTITLVPKGTAPEMVQVPGGQFPVGLSGFNVEAPQNLEAFEIDRYEVTNKDFKRFVDAGGYAHSEYWGGVSTEPFRDSTGRPGPATWELGEYSPDKADYPVGGVSWYEALAYCRAEAKALPTIYHWARAALSPVEIASPLAPAMIPLSQVGKSGPAPVGSSRGIGPYGTYDMAGNVREWAWNESSEGRRWILGGAWNDPTWMLVVPNSLPPLDRAATDGVRCMRTAKNAAVPDRLLARVDNHPDRRGTKAVSDEVFEVFKRQLAFVGSPLNARVESRDTSPRDWVKERISFDAGYEAGRVQASLFLPRTTKPPFQAVVVFGGLGDFIGQRSSEQLEPGVIEFVVKSGRALVYPVFKGSFERWDPFITLQGEEYFRTFRARIFHWRQDLGRVLDVLSQRQDIDRTRFAYLGISFGSSTPLPLLAVEDRLKTAVLLAPGIPYRLLPPEVDAINYVSHITMPILMLGGRHDYVFPLETAQKPLFDRLGTLPDRKRHVVFDAGHMDYPRSELIREVVAWLDRYLGPITTRATSETQ